MYPTLCFPGISSANQESHLTDPFFFSILSVCLGLFCPCSKRNGGFYVARSWKDLHSRNIARRIGSEERPEWDASPAKPSKPLRIEARSERPPLGVRTEFLAGIS